MTLTLTNEQWPVAGTFRIARGVQTQVPLLIAELRDGPHVGRGEAAGVNYHDETVASMRAQIEAVRTEVEAGLDRMALLDLLPAGGARNALDCALWDLEAKRTGTPAWQLAQQGPPDPLTTAYTISLDTPEAMAAKARAHATYRLLKVKLGTAEDDVERIRLIREAAPEAALIVDANEGWTFEQVEAYAPALHELGVLLIEQPLPDGQDEALSAYRGPVPLCADESCQTSASLDALSPGYAYVNIKLDKTGGLTEAFHLLRAAQARNLGLMVGCMLGTSLGMAPAFLIGQHCRFVDLDGPLLQAKDRTPGIRYNGSTMHAPPPELWG
ncbi:MAG: N-acetyl-D-Glu racemase DgcA [Bacteroidota bacterium]